MKFATTGSGHHILPGDIVLGRDNRKYIVVEEEKKVFTIDHETGAQEYTNLEYPILIIDLQTGKIEDGFKERCEVRHHYRLFARNESVTITY